MERVLDLLHVDAGERPPGAANGIKRPVGFCCQPWYRSKLFIDRIAQATLVAGVAREAQGPDRQGSGSADLPAGHRYQFRAATTEIADNAAGVRDASNYAES